MDVKHLRKLAGLTQAQLAERLGIPRRTIENWDAGVNRAPDYVVRLIEHYLMHEGMIAEGAIAEEKEEK